MHVLWDRLIKDYINPTIFYRYILQADDESKEVNSISTECILIQLTI